MVDRPFQFLSRDKYLAKRGVDLRLPGIEATGGDYLILVLENIPAMATRSAVCNTDWRRGNHHVLQQSLEHPPPLRKRSPSPLNLRVLRRLHRVVDIVRSRGFSSRTENPSVGGTVANN